MSRKKVLIDYEKLRTLLGFESYDLAQSYHKKLVNEYLRGANNIRDDKWTKGIAVGSEDFVKRIKATLGIPAKGRKSRETPEAYQLRESPLPYSDHFGDKNDDIGSENTYFGDINPE